MSFQVSNRLVVGALARATLDCGLPTTVMILLGRIDGPDSLAGCLTVVRLEGSRFTNGHWIQSSKSRVRFLQRENAGEHARRDDLVDPVSRRLS